MIAATERYLKTVNNATKIVPGHGPLATRADLQVFHDMLARARDRVKKLLGEGKSEQQVLAAKPLADLDPKWAAPQGVASNHRSAQRLQLVAQPRLNDGSGGCRRRPPPVGAGRLGGSVPAGVPQCRISTRSSCS
jgi:hypothetical protein